MLLEVNKDDVVYSGKGIRFRVLYLARHGQDCSISMVVYMNEEPTLDYQTGTIWTMEENLFLKKFHTKNRFNSNHLK